MKNTLLFLLLIGAALPAAVRADAPSSPSTNTAKITRTAPAKPARASSHKVVYYITQESRTGSYIPVVYRRYNGRIDSASSPAVYGQNSIAQTGALDVGTAIYKLDPSITFGRR